MIFTCPLLEFKDRTLSWWTLDSIFYTKGSPVTLYSSSPPFSSILIELFHPSSPPKFGPGFAFGYALGDAIF